MQQANLWLFCFNNFEACTFDKEKITDNKIKIECFILLSF